MKPVKKSVLLKTSVISDVQHSGGVLTIAGLQGLRVNDILDIKQIKYKAEVSQVVKVAYSLYTPTADTRYTVELEFMLSTREGYTGITKTYAYTTPSLLTNIGATAALQREYIHLQIVADINADTSVPVTAASLLTGTGFTLTDDAGYYPALLNGRKGPTNVRLLLNADGSGWSNASTENVVTTVGVISFGEGQRMLDDTPIIAGYDGGNLISGSLDAPKTIGGLYATAGQHYDAFIISALQTCPAYSITGQLAYVPVEYAVFVDNGTGSATTNLAGFKTFERAVQKEMFGIVYGQDTASVIEWFDKGYSFQANPGITPYTGTIAGTADVMKYFQTPYGTSLEQYNINAQTIFSPLQTATGLAIEQDVTATDGAHYCAGTLALSPNSFIVGKTEFSVVARVVAGDWTDAFFMVGFRKKAVYAADYTTYDDLGAIGTQVSAANDYVATQGNINNGTMKETVSSTAIAADAVSVELLVKVDISGNVTAYRDGVSFPIYSVGTTALVFDAGDEMIPFFQYINLNSSASTLTFSSFVAVPSKDWRL